MLKLIKTIAMCSSYVFDVRRPKKRNKEEIKTTRGHEGDGKKRSLAVTTGRSGEVLGDEIKGCTQRSGGGGGGREGEEGEELSWRTC